jgi:serine/threonine-protein kinase
MDFGAGHEADDSPGKATAGTPLYLAPEVLSGGAATPRSDVYSIGVVLFRLLTGSYPVLAGDLADLRRAHATGDGADARLRC